MLQDPHHTPFQDAAWLSGTKAFRPTPAIDGTNRPTNLTSNQGSSEPLLSLGKLHTVQSKLTVHTNNISKGWNQGNNRARPQVQ